MNTGGFGKQDTTGTRNVNCLGKETFLFKCKEKTALKSKHPPRELIAFGTYTAHSAVSVCVYLGEKGVHI